MTNRNLDDVGGDQVEALEAAQDRPQLARRPASCLGGAGCGGDCALVSTHSYDG